MGDSAEIKIGEIEIGGRRYEVSGSVGGTGIPDRILSKDELLALYKRTHPLDSGRFARWHMLPGGTWQDMTRPAALLGATPDGPDGTSEPAKVETWHDRPSLL
jgi:hypothetical protein